MRMLAYSFSMLLQVFLPCYYRNKISSASEKIGESLFHSNWIQGDRKYRTAVKIFLENTKKPIIVSALSVLNMDFGTFTTICNSAYSLYALFKKVNGK